MTAQQITLESDERVGLGPRGLLTGAGAGDALVVAAGRRFRNDATAGAAALAVTDRDARWLLYLDAFAGLDRPGAGAARLRSLRPRLRRHAPDPSRL